LKRVVASLLVIALLAISLSAIAPVMAGDTINEGVNGTVYENGVPVAGITIHVYRESTGQLEGYGVNDDNTKGLLGTDVTDENGYYHIAWLWTGVTYVVEAVTPCGTFTEEFTLSSCGETAQVDFCYTCVEPRTVGYWKTHPCMWPVDEIEIGGVTYGKWAALLILWMPSLGDATIILAKQLIAAKLNIANGVCAPSLVTETIENADEFLVEYPLGSKPKGEARDYALELKDILDDFNNGLIPCGP